MPGLRAVVDDRPAFSDRPATGAAGSPVPIAAVMMRADMARMFLAWADGQNRLGDLFAAFRHRDPGRFGQPGQSSSEIVERVLGADLATIDATVRAASSICEYKHVGGVVEWATPRDRACFDAYNAPAR